MIARFTQKWTDHRVDSASQTRVDHSRCTEGPPLTIFAMPKPFLGQSGIIQRNAIQSWLRLRPRPEIMLFGNDAGVEQTAAEWECVHEPNVRRNEHGTPLMDDMFRLAHQRASHSTLVYVNADIILLDDFMTAVGRIAESRLDQFMMIGRRIDTDVDAIDFERVDWRERLLAQVAQVGSLAPRVCKDYFVFRKPLLSEIPPFAIGRSPFDNWFVYHAKQQGVPVIEASRVVKAIHQNHGYGHVPGGRRQAYVKGEETKRNQALAGGMRLISGSTATWIMTPHQLRRRRLPGDFLQFVTDLPRFLLLVLELYGWIKTSPRRNAQDSSRNGARYQELSPPTSAMT